MWVSHTSTAETPPRPPLDRGSIMEAVGPIYAVLGIALGATAIAFALAAFITLMGDPNDDEDDDA